ncbi:efflux RND transporter periplasmic adaptor subunit [Dyella sp.]|uniref:efflux RND transporter periplasmic adaptor subunit n=1 Tax=Dyella sp. TaxID=1869338 RepID=UPI002ED0F153
MKRWLIMVAAAFLGACHHNEASDAVTVRVTASPLEFSVEGLGELRSNKSTPMLVPGQTFAPRQVVWMLPDGSHVQKGDLVARFSAEQSKNDLQQALVDLARNALAREGKQDELGSKAGQIGVDLVQVDGQLAIAHRYAHATLAALARNDILDAVLDENYLRVRQGILQWRDRQSSTRGAAELAVIDAQKDTYQQQVKQKQDDLSALELRAPYEGMVVLERDWAGQVPHVGVDLWAGNSFASLPDLSSLEVQLSVPQIDAQGIQIGDDVELHPWGDTQQTLRSRVSWIAGAAQARSRDNPVKYLDIKVPVPAEMARKFDWTPGRTFAGRIILLHSDRAMSVPSIALVDGDHVNVLRDGKVVRQAVKLGVRTASLVQVMDGLKEGDQVVLVDATAKQAKELP